MGYVRKHKQEIRSAAEFALILTVTLGTAPALIWLAGLDYLY